MWPCDWCLRLKSGYLLYRKSSINPPGVLIETGGLFNSEKMMVFAQEQSHLFVKNNKGRVGGGGWAY